MGLKEISGLWVVDYLKEDDRRGTMAAYMYTKGMCLLSHKDLIKKRLSETLVSTRKLEDLPA